MTSNYPIYAYSPYGLANRLLGLASTMYICHVLNRPLVLIWEQNSQLGYTDFRDIFESSIDTVSKKPAQLPTVVGENTQTHSSFHADTAVILECHDICKFPGLDEQRIHLELKALRVISQINQRIISFSADHDLNALVGVHVRYGDKWRGGKMRRLRELVESRYDEAVREVLDRTGFNIYLSCDDVNVWKRYRKLYGGRIISGPKHHDPLFRNKDSIPEALLDLYLLSRTRYMLYGVGTFGYAAHLLGGNRGFNILYSEKNFFLWYDLLVGQPVERFPDIRAIVTKIASSN